MMSGWKNLKDHFTITASGTSGGKNFQQTTEIDSSNQWMSEYYTLPNGADVESFNYNGTLFDHFLTQNGVQNHWYGRAYSPGGAMAGEYQSYLTGLANDTSWVKDITFGDTDATCATLAGTSAVKFTYNNTDEGRRAVFWAEAAAPHRMLSRIQVDSFQGDNFRKDFSYTPKPVVLDTSTATRVATRLDFVVKTATKNARGGYHFELQIGVGSTWPKISEIRVDVAQRYSGSPTSVVLRTGTQTFTGGSVGYVDTDGDNVVSPGDLLTIDLDAGLQPTFWDLWASSQASTEPTVSNLIQTAGGS